MQILGTDRFILSPVDNVTGDSDQVWRNVAALVETWKELRGVSWRRCQRRNYVQ